MMGFPTDNPLHGAAESKVPGRGLGWPEKPREERDSFSLPGSTWSHGVSALSGRVFRSPQISLCLLHSVSRHVFIEQLLCTTHCARPQGHNSEQDRQKPHPCRTDLLEEEDRHRNDYTTSLKFMAISAMNKNKEEKRIERNGECDPGRPP